MKSRRYPFLLKLLALFGVMLMALGMLRELPLVLCFEPNGQVELEALTLGGVCADWQANAKPNSLIKGEVRHCMDLPLSQLSVEKVICKATASLLSQWGGLLLERVLVFSHQIFNWARLMQPVSQWANPPPLLLGVIGLLKTVILLL